MNWFALVVVVLVLGGVGCLFWKLHGGQDAPVSRIGCGKCVATGECVLVNERICGKKADNP